MNCYNCPWYHGCYADSESKGSCSMHSTDVNAKDEICEQRQVEVREARLK